MQKEAYFFQTKYLSVSDIKTLRRMLKKESFLVEDSYAIQVANIVDAVLTKDLTLQDVNKLYFDNVKRCVDAYQNRKIKIQHKKKQHEYYCIRHGCYVRAKCDLLSDKYIEDIKTTSLKLTFSTALNMISFFDYDMQAAAYLEIFKRDFFVFSFLSYSSNNCVQICVEREDQIFESGFKKWMQGIEMGKLLGYNAEI